MDVYYHSPAVVGKMDKDLLGHFCDVSRNDLTATMHNQSSQTWPVGGVGALPVIGARILLLALNLCAAAS